MVRCSKKRYISKREAKVMMKRINNKEGYDLKNAYYCTECVCWHLTSGERKTHDPKRQR